MDNDVFALDNVIRKWRSRCSFDKNTSYCVQYGRKKSCVHGNVRRSEIKRMRRERILICSCAFRVHVFPKSFWSICFTFFELKLKKIKFFNASWKLWKRYDRYFLRVFADTSWKKLWIFLYRTKRDVSRSVTSTKYRYVTIWENESHIQSSNIADRFEDRWHATYHCQWICVEAIRRAERRRNSFAKCTLIPFKF